MNKETKSDGTVGKALEILDSVASFGRPVKFVELLDTSTYPKTTLYRFLQTLTNQHMLAYDENTGTYSMGIRLVRLAHGAWNTASLAPIARPFIEALSAQCGETVHLAQYDDGQVLFVDKMQTSRFETLAQVGKVAPSYCTGVGKAMLAFLAPKRLELALRQQSFYRYTEATHGSMKSLSAELKQISVDGVAFDREEHQEGIISIATPILSNEGRVLGALSIATTTSRHSLDGLEQFRAPLLETTKKIGEEASHWQPPSR